MNDHGISKTELKKHNRTCILRAMWESGPISRVDIARKLQITRGAITILTNEMIEQKLIKESADGLDGTSHQVQKGRRKVLLDIDYSSFFVLGACVDKENISVGLTTLDGKAMEKANLSIKKGCTAEMAAAMIRDAAESILSHSGLDINGIIALGIGVMPEADVFRNMRLDDGSCDHRSIEKLFSKHFDIPVFSDDGIMLLSYACYVGDDRGKSIANRAFLFSDKDSFRMSVVCGNILRSDSMTVSDACNELCVNPGGEQLEGFCRGAAAAELTPAAIGKKIAKLYSVESTPELYRMTNGDCSAVTIGQLLDACVMGDSMLESLCMETLDLFCLMLNNITVLYQAERISLCGFGLDQHNISRFLSRVGEVGGIALAEKIKTCRIDSQHRFICGCINAIINGFFRTGGVVRQNGE